MEELSWAVPLLQEATAHMTTQQTQSSAVPECHSSGTRTSSSDSEMITGFFFCPFLTHLPFKTILNLIWVQSLSYLKGIAVNGSHDGRTCSNAWFAIAANLLVNSVQNDKYKGTSTSGFTYLNLKLITKGKNLNKTNKSYYFLVQVNASKLQSSTLQA